MKNNIQNLLNSVPHVWFIQQSDVEHDQDSEFSDEHGRVFSASITCIKDHSLNLLANANSQDFINSIEEEISDIVREIEPTDIFSGPTIEIAKANALSHVQNNNFLNYDDFIDSLEHTHDYGRYRTTCEAVSKAMNIDLNNINELHWDASQLDSLTPLEAVLAIK